MSAFAQVKTSTSVSDTLLTTSATVATDATFDPVGYVAPGVARWENRSGGIPVGFPTLHMSVRPPSKTSRLYKVVSKLAIPTLEQTSASTSTGIQPAPVKAYDCQAILEVLLPERSTLAERAILLNQLVSLLFNTITASDGSPSTDTATPMRAAILNFERPY